MSKLTKLMGAASILALGALMVSPASAGSIMSPGVVAQAGYAHGDNAGFGSNAVFLGGAIGGPLGFEGLGAEVDGQLSELWASDWSAIDWNGGGDVFWGGDMGRFGLDGHGVHYHYNGDNTNNANVGAFGEYYVGNFTVAAKGGFIFPTGGHGNYLGADAVFYVMPDLALEASFGWFDYVYSDRTFSPDRYDIRDDIIAIQAEWMPFEEIPITANPFFVYDTYPGDHATMLGIRFKYYLGGGGESLIDRHRNGLLRDWVRGTDWYYSVL